jgi:hypothetical protein
MIEEKGGRRQADTTVMIYSHLRRRNENYEKYDNFGERMRMNRRAVREKGLRNGWDCRVKRQKKEGGERRRHGSGRLSRVGLGGVGRKKLKNSMSTQVCLLDKCM